MLSQTGIKHFENGPVGRVFCRMVFRIAVGICDISPGKDLHSIGIIMVHFAINTYNNSITVSAEAGSSAAVVHRWSRRWEALLLSLLVAESKTSRGLAVASFYAALAQRGQVKALTRAQVLRLFNSLTEFFSQYPGAGLRTETPPRKASVGPWFLRHEPNVGFCVDGAPAQSRWPHPGLTQDPLDTEQLYSFLSNLMVADALAAEGRFAPAIEMLLSLNQQPLTDEACGLLHLRLSHWYKHIGDFARARAQAQAAISRPAIADPGLLPTAQFMLQRIDYDENPAGSWEHLWQTSNTPPKPSDAQHPQTPHCDWRTLAEWHNLRALLARRRLHAVANSPTHPQPAQQPPTHPDTVAALHACVLQHHQAALYMAAWFRDWDRLQAYVANLAFHLQLLLGLNQSLGVGAPLVLRWHRLTMAYESKFFAGRDSAWEYIFFGKFWLDNHASLPLAAASDPLAHCLGDTSPEQETFYQRALERLRECGDPRQVAIGHSLYLRFAQHHMTGRSQKMALETQTEALLHLIKTQPHTGLLKSLIAEGYQTHWPADLRERLRKRGGSRYK
jgi:hypothetical protein